MIEKLKSRKFIVFLVWLIIVVFKLVFDLKDTDGILEYFFFISLIYVGGEAILDGMKLKGKI